jgi:hypothetical protein
MRGAAIRHSTQNVRVFIARNSKKLYRQYLFARVHDSGHCIMMQNGIRWIRTRIDNPMHQRASESPFHVPYSARRGAELRKDF